MDDGRLVGVTAPQQYVSTLNVNEMFGPTIQGEGRHAGRMCSFLRLSGCNLSCSWCDTPYTWDWNRFDHDAETHRSPVDEVARHLDLLPGRLVVSGGEPLLQAPALAALLTRLDGRTFDVETNGTRRLGATEGMWDTVTCSPKVVPSAAQRSNLPGAIHPSVTEVADFKFVVRDTADLNAVLTWLTRDEQGVRVPFDRVWIMPEGTSAAVLTERTPFVVDAAARYGFNFSTRLHVYGWHDTRGH